MDLGIRTKQILSGRRMARKRVLGQNTNINLLIIFCV